MSGDVQPRKRKDKKKKKDEEVNDDINIHVHKDGGTGGNICSKIVFFFLFSALILLIGLIIKENQGLNELESIEEESRFSQIFEGWIEDKPPAEHDDKDDHFLEPDNHDDDHTEEDDEDDGYGSEEDDHLEDKTEEVEESRESEEEEDLEEDEESTARSEEEETVEETDEENDEPDSEEQRAEETTEEKFEDHSEAIENSDEEEKNNEETESKSKEDDKQVEESKEDDKKREVQEEEELQAKQKLENETEIPTKDVEKETSAKHNGNEQPPVDTKEPSTKVNVGDEAQSDSDGEDYEHSNIINKDDHNIRADIEAANEQLQKNAAYANKLFDMLLDKYSLSPRLLYGKAMALDILAEEQQSNDILNKALSFYSKALDVPNVPDMLFVLIAERYISRARFLGQYKNAIGAHWKLIERFPENAAHLNDLAVTYLTINMQEEARSVLKKVLAKWPADGFALVHYGFILKMADNDLEGSVEYLDKGLKTKAPGVIDGRFFLYLGDSLLRLNRKEEANKIHEEGVKQNVFFSKYQRSLYNVPRLTGKPWWQPEDLPTYHNFFAALKDNWKKIRSEGFSVLSKQGFYEDEAENLKDKGTWKQLELFARGHKSKKNCEKAPITCQIVHRFSEASSCRRGQTKFSVMHPGTHVWPHCGPTNCRLRVHLGLKVPPGTFIRVGENTRSWKEGDIIIFDDSFEHEVWHNGTEFRLVLIVDVWHPELTPTEKTTLSSI